jgi:plasmid replication initiation protein
VAKIKQELVTKSNRLVEASYRLSLNEQRIVLYAICRCREEQRGLSNDSPITIRADVFAKQFDLDLDNSYGYLREAMESLYDRSVVFHDEDPSTGLPRVNKTRWISRASYIDGAGHIQIIFTSDVVKYFTRIEKELTSYHLESVKGITSAYAVRIYELLRQYLSLGTRTLEIAWLREALQIPDDEYKATADFIRRVINVSVVQINDHTDMKVDHKAKKTGRAITAFVFKIKHKDTVKKKKNPVIDDDYIKKHARPGELRDEVYKRLQRQKTA